MAIKRAFRMCRVQLREMMVSPMTYVFICLLFVYFHHLNAPAVRLQKISELSVNAWGYTAAVFSARSSVLVFALGATAMFSDLPLIRENILFESCRCSRNVWISGRILYIGIMSILYTGMMCFLCILTSRGSVLEVTAWGKLLNTMARGYEVHNISLPIEIQLSYITSFSPVEAFGIMFLFAAGSAFLLGLIILCVSLFLNRIQALLVSGVIAMFDFMMEGKLPYYFYRWSPFSFMRMSIVANPDMPYFPTVPEAAVFLSLAAVMFILLSYLACRNNKKFSRHILKEQY